MACGLDEGRRIGPERMCAESARRGGEAEGGEDKDHMVGRVCDKKAKRYFK